MFAAKNISEGEAFTTMVMPGRSNGFFQAYAEESLLPGTPLFGTSFLLGAS
jgi:hypothetical protein